MKHHKRSAQLGSTLSYPPRLFTLTQLLSAKAQPAQVLGLRALLTLPLKRHLLGVGVARCPGTCRAPRRGFLPVLTTSDAPWSQVAPKVAFDGQRAPLTAHPALGPTSHWVPTGGDGGPHVHWVNTLTRQCRHHGVDVCMGFGLSVNPVYLLTARVTFRR